MKHYDCIVVGFGTAGSMAAIHAAEFGASVLVLERGTTPVERTRRAVSDRIMTRHHVEH